MSALAKPRFQGTVQPWGNSLGIRITRPISDMSHLVKGDKVDIEVTEDGILVSRKQVKRRLILPYTEADLLSGMTPKNAHADELPSLLGSEVGD